MVIVSRQFVVRLRFEDAGINVYLFIMCFLLLTFDHLLDFHPHRARVTPARVFVRGPRCVSDGPRSSRSSIGGGWSYIYTNPRAPGGWVLGRSNHLRIWARSPRVKSRDLPKVPWKVRKHDQFTQPRPR